MNVPSGGIILGYFFVCILTFSSADRSGPGYRGASFRSLEPCEGGTNLVGFSRTRALEGFLLGALVDAWRMFRDWDGIVKRVLQIAPRWGRRNRGIATVEDMAVGAVGPEVVIS